MSSPNSSQEQEPASDRPRVARPRKACIICRGLKTRCLPCDPGDHPLSRCARCTRLDLQCDYKSARRGPPKGYRRKHDSYAEVQPPAKGPRWSFVSTSMTVDPPDANGGPASPSSPMRTHSQSTISPAVESPTYLKHSADLVDHLQHSNRSASRLSSARVPVMATGSFSLPSSSTSQTLTSPVEIAQAPYPPSSSYDPNSPQDGRVTQGSISWSLHVGPSWNPSGRKGSRSTMEAYLEPHIGDDDSRAASVEPEERGPTLSKPLLPMSVPDVVLVGLLSEPEASWLFRRFVDFVSPSSHLFDHTYHTFERIRESPVLFNSIMFASSRFFRPQLADWCLELAETAINRTMRNGIINLPLVQALLTLVYWKRPKDPTAYHKLGMAARCVCQLGIKWKIDDVDPTMSEEAERSQVDAERTAYNAFGDGSYAIMFRLPAMGWPIPSAAELRRWANNHLHLKVQGDMFKVFLTEVWELHYEVGAGVFPSDQVRSKDDRPNDCPPHIGGTMGLERATSMDERWMACPDLQGIYRTITALMIKTILIKQHLLGVQSGYSTFPDVIQQLEEFSTIVVSIAASREVVYFSDMSACLLSMPALQCYHARHLLQSQQDLGCALSSLRTVSSALEELFPLIGEDHALRYVHRCHYRISNALDKFKPGEQPDGPDDVLSQLQELLNQNWSHTPVTSAISDGSFGNDSIWMYPTPLF